MKGGYKIFLDKFHEKFGDAFSFPNIETEYVNNKSTVTVKCNKCGYVFTTTPNYLLCAKLENKCRNCRKLEYAEDHGITYDELANKVPQYDIQPYEGYKSLKNGTVLVKCEMHGYQRCSVKNVLGAGFKCKTCQIIQEAKNRIPPIEKVKELIKEKYGDYVTPYDETYVNTSLKMRFKCNVCGKDFERTPNAFIFSKLMTPCPHCTNRIISKERTKSQEDFIKEVIAVHGEDAFSFEKTKYVQSGQKVTLTCKKCGKDFEIEANSLLQGHGCPRHYRNRSHIENSINEYINGLGIETEENNRSMGTELDIFIPSKNIGLEVDGVFWHSEFYKDDDYHLKKTIQCEEKGIRLIHIFEDEWIRKKEICQSMITNILGKTANKIYARKCEIKEVDSSDASSFLDENHIQGKCGSRYRYGLYYNGELVSIMTFGLTRHFIGNSSHQYELLRFCNKKFCNVVGGASKLFKHFLCTINPENIVSYADRRWSIGNLYYKLGFQLYNKSKPNYFYVIGDKRLNRFNFRKSILVEKYGCPKDMSEREFCRSKKWLRIYDCGCLCFEWNND